MEEISMKIAIKLIRFFFVFIVLSIACTIIMETKPQLIALLALVAGGYVLWEFKGIWKKK